MMVVTDDCTGCGLCVPACPTQAIRETEDCERIEIDLATCDGCPDKPVAGCLEVCPVQDALVPLTPTAVPAPHAAHLQPGEAPQRGESAVAPRRLHGGWLLGGGLSSAMLGMVGLAVAFHPHELYALWIGVAVVLGIVVGVLAFHLRCPGCRGLFARRTLKKWLSHTTTQTVTEHDSSGRHRTRQVTRKVYAGSFECRRCGNHWTGYV